MDHADHTPAIQIERAVMRVQTGLGIAFEISTRHGK